MKSEIKRLVMQIAHPETESPFANGFVTLHEDEFVTYTNTVRNTALNEACGIVFGYCDSDNVAQRTVDEIRKLKVGK